MSTDYNNIPPAVIDVQDICDSESLPGFCKPKRESLIFKGRSKDDDSIARLKDVLPGITDMVTLSREGNDSLSGPCPLCGGDDRFVYKINSGKFWCRHCHDKPGDVIDFHRWYTGATITDLKEKHLNTDDFNTKPQYNKLKEQAPALSMISSRPENGKISSLEDKWERISSVINKPDSLYPLFDRRAIPRENVDMAFQKGILRVCNNHRGKRAAAVRFDSFDGSITAIQFLSVDEQPFDGTDDKRVFHVGSKASEGFFYVGPSPEKAERIVVVESIINAFSGVSVIPDYCWIAVGSTTSTRKLDELRPFKEKVVLCFDADLPGRNATNKASTILGGEIRSVIWPSETPVGYDINDLLKAGSGEEIKNLIDSSEWVSPDKKKNHQQKSKKTHGVKMSDLEILDLLVDKLGIENVLFDGLFCWEWRSDKGVWRKVSDWIIRQGIIKLGGDENLNNSKVNSVLGLFKANIYRSNFQFKFDRVFVNCPNGELHLESGVFVLKKHVRENYCITQVPVQYDPNASCPRFEQFLSEVFEGDPDANEKSMLVYQMIGYCLLSSCKFEKFFILIGPGANGKSVLMDVLKEIVGSENTASVQPSQFENKFQRAHLYGKLLNLVCEIAEGAQIADAQLKAIVSGEYTTAEHKYMAPFEFEPFSTCVFGTNHMPHTRDFSNALFRRVSIIRFNRTFEEEEQDRFLKEKLKQELPGILTRAIYALEDVFAHNGFSEPESSRQAKGEWMVEADQVAQFIDECCTLMAGESIQSKRIYDYYLQWANDAGIQKKLNQKNFTTRLTRFGIGRARGHGGVRLLTGIVFNGVTE